MAASFAHRVIVKARIPDRKDSMLVVKVYTWPGTGILITMAALFRFQFRCVPTYTASVQLLHNTVVSQPLLPAKLCSVVCIRLASVARLLSKHDYTCCLTEQRIREVTTR